jgi:hypothetical protein
MMLDLNALETDQGVKLPPYVSRSTLPSQNLMHDPAFMAAREIFAKHEQTVSFNQQFTKEFCNG